MRSAIYTGQLQHRRHTQKRNDFRYEVLYWYLDLAEVASIFSIPLLFSRRSPKLLGFDRRDYLGTGPSLADSVRKLIHERTGRAHTGPIRLLTQIRYVGFCFNPVSFYYCFDARGEELEFIVAEITNTPWNERRAYVLEWTPGAEKKTFDFEKDFHVSPFMPMKLGYVWTFSAPRPENAGSPLTVVMEAWEGKTRVFDAFMRLSAEPLTRFRALKAVVEFPLLTFKAFAAIYFQALRLKLKGVPFYPHPDRGGKP